jgi:hypothetical protein
MEIEENQKLHEYSHTTKEDLADFADLTAMPPAFAQNEILRSEESMMTIFSFLCPKL